MADETEVKELVALASRLLARELENFDFLGHVSWRQGDSMYIKGRHASVGSMSRLQAKHIMKVSLEGAKLENADWDLPSETFMHTEIYKSRQDVQAVIHTHQPLATAFACAGRPLVPIYHPILSKQVFGEKGKPLPVHKTAELIYTVEQAKALAKTLRDRNICLIQGHGVVVVGRSVEEAALRAIALEEQARWNMLALSIGKPIAIPAAILKRARDATVRGRWNYLVSLFDSK
ncbi:MAG: class II aldolase/adducin family protein [Deltaproteobacteria bacterium]|nr:class II aldolase/adducin family protein [Deltaproteobacteria bacterium]